MGDEGTARRGLGVGGGQPEGEAWEGVQGPGRSLELGAGLAGPPCCALSTPPNPSTTQGPLSSPTQLPSPPNWERQGKCGPLPPSGLPTEHGGWGGTAPPHPQS